jgi:sigma-E factor negative regulatory protein RseC
MSNFKTIDHEGVVKKNDNKSVTVQITSKSACSGCHAEGSCSMSGKKEKIIDIAGNYDLKEGDCVTVQMNKSLGYSAVALGYLIPFAIVITTLVISLALKLKESYAGIIAILSVFPYYLFLLLCKKKISNKFAFSLKTK